MYVYIGDKEVYIYIVVEIFFLILMVKICFV